MEKQNYTLNGLFDLLHPHMTKEEERHAIDYLVELKIQEYGLTFENPDRVKVFTDKNEYLEYIYKDKQMLKHSFPTELYREDISFKEVANYFDEVSRFDSSFSNLDTIYINPDDCPNIGVFLATVEHEMEHIYQYHNDIYDNIPYYIYDSYIIPESLEDYLVENHSDKIEFIDEFLHTLKVNFYEHHYARSYMEDAAYAMSTYHIGYNLLKYLETKEDLPLVNRVWLYSQAKNLLRDDMEVQDEVYKNRVGISKKDYPTTKYNLLKILSIVNDSPEALDFMDTLCGLTSYCRFGKDFKTDFTNLIDLKFYSAENPAVINKLILDYASLIDTKDADFTGIRQIIEEKVEILDVEEVVEPKSQSNNEEVVEEKVTTEVSTIDD